MIRRMISQLLSSQAAASFCALGSDFRCGGSVSSSARAAVASSPISCIRSMLKRVLLAYWMSLARSDTSLKFRGSVSLGVEIIDLNDAGGGQWSFVHHISDRRVGYHAAVPVVVPVDRDRGEAGRQSATGSDMVRVDKRILRIEIGGGALAYVHGTQRKPDLPAIDQIKIHQLF